MTGECVVEPDPPGTVPCTCRRNGSGVERCDGCDGRGWIDGVLASMESKTCSKCEGAGWMTCTTCGGCGLLDRATGADLLLQEE